MGNDCPNCGNANDPGARFCFRCGTPLSQAGNRQSAPQNVPQRGAPQSAPRQPAYWQNAPQASYPTRQPVVERTEPPAPKHTGKKLLCLFLALLLAGELAVAAHICPGFVENGFFPGEISEEGGESPAQSGGKTKSKAYAEVTAENSAVTLCGITVDANRLNLLAGSERVEVTVKEAVTEADGSVVTEYDVSMGEHRELDAPVKLTFPCSDDEDVTVSVEHYVEELGWVPLICRRDSDGGTVTVMTGSLSPMKKKETKAPPAGLFCVSEPGTWNAKLEISSSYMDILQNFDASMLKGEADKFISNPEKYAIEYPSMEDVSTLEGMNAANAKAGRIWTALGPAIELYTQTPLNEHSQKKIVQFMCKYNPALARACNFIPFAGMAIQAGIDCYRDGTLYSETAAQNGYKGLMTNANSFYWLHTGYGHFGYTLTFAGVTLFSMELDALLDEAKEEQARNRFAVYEAYYKDVRPFVPEDWYEMYVKAYRKGNGNAQKAMDYMLEKVNEYVNRFWTDVYDTGNDELIFAAEAAGLRNVYMNATDAEKQELSLSMKLYVWGRIENEVMPWISDYLTERLQEDVLKNLSPIIEPYNRELHFDILETVDMNTGALPKYLGYTICLGSEGKPVSDWSQTIPDDDELTDGWERVFDCTVYGWLSYGMPDQVLIYEKASDLKNGREPVRVVPFEPVLEGDCTAVINLSGTDTVAWGLRSVTCEYYSPGESETPASGIKTEKCVSAYCDEDEFEVVYFLSYSLTGSRYYYAHIGTMPGRTVDWNKEFRLNVASYTLGGAYAYVFVNGKYVPGSSSENTDGRKMDNQTFRHFEPDYSFFDGTGLVEDCLYNLNGYLPECAAGAEASVRIEMANMTVTYRYAAAPKSEVEQWQPDVITREVGYDAFVGDRWCTNLDSHR